MADYTNGTINAPDRISGTLSLTPGQIDAALSVPERIPADAYEGPYEFTPSSSEQVIEIQDKLASENIIINPVPSNYGLIAWDGSTITVS